VLIELKGTKVEVDALMKIMLELLVNDQDAYMIISIVRAIMRTVICWGDFCPTDRNGDTGLKGLDLRIIFR
jgi:hypothetical protein